MTIKETMNDAYENVKSWDVKGFVNHKYDQVSAFCSKWKGHYVETFNAHQKFAKAHVVVTTIASFAAFNELATVAEERYGSKELPVRTVQNLTLAAAVSVAVYGTNVVFSKVTGYVISRRMHVAIAIGAFVARIIVSQLITLIKNDQLKKDKVALNQTINQLNNDKTQLNNDKATLRTEIGTLTSVINLNQKIGSLNNDLAALRQQHQAAQSQANADKLKIQELTSQIEQAIKTQSDTSNQANNNNNTNNTDNNVTNNDNININNSNNNINDNHNPV